MVERESDLDRVSKEFLTATGEFVHQVRKAIPSKESGAIVSKKNFFSLVALLVSLVSLGLAGTSFFYTNIRLNDADLKALHDKVDQLSHARNANAQLSGTTKHPNPHRPGDRA